MTWTAAQFTGDDDDVVTYTVTAHGPNGTTAGTMTTTGNSVVFTDIGADAGDITYTFKVTGKNDYGTSPSATTNAVTPASVPGGTAAYQNALEAYHYARGGLMTGSYVDAGDAAANSAYGAQFLSHLTRGQESALRERISVSEDDRDNAWPETQLSEVLAMPSADGSTVTLRATVKITNVIVTDVSTSTADPTDETGSFKMRYTFTAGDKPVVLSAVTASANEMVVQQTSAALADFGNDIDQELQDEDTEPSVFDGDSTDDGSDGTATPVSFHATQAGSYARTGAATWAVSNWDAKALYDSDCTNFVSRAITKGGGVREKGDGGEWYRSTDAWWRNPGQWGHDETLSWINAAYFKTFVSKHMLSSKRNTSNAYTGDVILYDWQDDGKVDHASIISKISNGKIYVTQHTKNYKYRSFSAQRAAEPKMKFWIYRIKPEWY